MAVNIGPQIGLNGEAAYTKSLKNIIAQSKALQAEMKAVTSAFDANDSSQKKLESQINVLNKQIETQQQRVKLLGDAYTQSSDKADKLNQELQDAVSKYGATSTEAQKAATALDKQQQAAQRARTEYLNATTALNKMTSELGSLTSETNQVSTPMERLTDTISQQQRELEQLKSEYSNAVLEFGKGSNSAQRLAREIDSLSGDLKKNQQRADDAAYQIDDLGDSFDDAGDKAASFGDIFSAGILVEGIGQAVDALGELQESVKENRRIMASLEVSSQKAGYTAEETAQSYEHLYGVLGDDQTSATTLSNLQALGLSQDKLNELIDGAIGAWATYGDSIPIDSLSEAINETIRTGTVTGAFADVLNWAGTSEDAFNQKLSDTTDESGRAQLVLQELADQGLIKAGQAWQDTNEDIVNANKSQADFTENASRLSEIVTPIATSVQDLFNDIAGSVLDAAEGVDWKVFAENIDTVTENVKEFIDSWIDYRVDELQSAMELWQSILPMLQPVFDYLDQRVQSEVDLWQNLKQKIDEFVSAAQQIWAQIEPYVMPLIDFYTQLIDAQLNWASSAWESISSFFENLSNSGWSAIKEVSDWYSSVVQWSLETAGSIVRAFDDVKSGLSNVWNSVVSTVSQAANTVIEKINGMITGISGAVNSVIDALNGISITVPNWVPFFGGNSFDVNIGNIPTPQIPQLAKGGIVRSGSAIVGEAGPELMTVFGNRTVVQPLPASYSMPSTQASATQDKAIINAITAATRSIVQAVQANGGEIVIGDDVIYRSYNRERASRAIVTGGAY